MPVPLIYIPPRRHECTPPSSIGTGKVLVPPPLTLHAPGWPAPELEQEPMVVDVPIRPPDGTEWECDTCTQVWVAHDLPPYPNLWLADGRWEWRPETRWERWRRRRRDRNTPAGDGVVRWSRPPGKPFEFRSEQEEANDGC